jgi:lipopolysaccharide transport system ATP-binding protein
MHLKNSITVDGLSKKFELGALSHETMLRDSLVKLLRFPRRRSSRNSEILWALKDVSFGVNEGEVVGIIGRNGAGKSTLLKVLSKIMYPTSGRVRVRGRLASLLEVGTGFHEELTGRENVFLNGSILGMKKQEVDAKLDAIVSFAGVERFMETPIKRYSTGMRLRLGFAVAAHLDPDVLIVDEVLAVGDAAFQKKCLNAMEGMRSGGRTVLFVSHNMAAVENLCSRAIWIDSGQVKRDGPAREVIESYMATFADLQATASDLEHVTARRGTGEIRYTGVEFLSKDRQPQPVTRSGDSLVVRLHYRANQSIPSSSLGLRLYTELGTLVTETSTWHHGLALPELPPGAGYVDLEIDALNLLPARYFFTLGLTEFDGQHVYDYLDRCTYLDVETGNVYGSGRAYDSRSGIVFFPQRWNLNGVPLDRDLVVNGDPVPSSLEHDSSEIGK